MIGRALAHKNVSTTAIYVRLNLDSVRESLQKAATAMLAAGGLLPLAQISQTRETPRLCRGDSSSLTFKGVHQ